MKRRHEEKERGRMIEELKKDNDNLNRKRDRVLSACGMRSNNPNGLEVSPRKKIEEKPVNMVPMTPSMNKKEPNCILPPTNNKNLPPKPVHAINPNNNISYKMPPKPSPLIPSKQNNSVDYSRPSSRERGQQLSQRERSK